MACTTVTYSISGTGSIRNRLRRIQHHAQPTDSLLRIPISFTSRICSRVSVESLESQTKRIGTNETTCDWKMHSGGSTWRLLVDWLTIRRRGLRWRLRLISSQISRSGSTQRKDWRGWFVGRDLGSLWGISACRLSLEKIPPLTTATRNIGHFTSSLQDRKLTPRIPHASRRSITQLVVCRPSRRYHHLGTLGQYAPRRPHQPWRDDQLQSVRTWVRWCIHA